MLRSTLLALGLLTAALAPLTQAGEPGTAYCFGVACPCGNDDPNAGCVNSTGQGALLAALGSNSASAADLGFDVTGLSTHSVTIIVIGSSQQSLPFKDGKLCVSGQIWRLFKHNNSGAGGSTAFHNIQSMFLNNAPPVIFGAGDTWNFQSWYRDSPGGASGCGQKSNLSNAYNVTFTP